MADRPALSLATWRLSTALAHTAHALREYRAAPWRGGALVLVVAELWRALFGRKERKFLLLTAARAAEPEGLIVLEQHVAVREQYSSFLQRLSRSWARVATPTRSDAIS